METPYIINTHSHVNMLKDTSIDEAIKNTQNDRIITILKICKKKYLLNKLNLQTK